MICTRLTKLTIRLNTAAEVCLHPDPGMKTKHMFLTVISQRSRPPSSSLTTTQLVLAAYTSTVFPLAPPISISHVSKVCFGAATWWTGCLREACAPGEPRPSCTASGFSREECYIT